MHILAITIITILLFMLVGRLVALRTVGGGSIYASPLFCAVMGMGIWYLWFLALVVVAGLSFVTAWWIFAIGAALRIFIHSKVSLSSEELENFWMKTLLPLLLIAPTLFLAIGDVPLLEQEFLGWLKTAKQIFEFGTTSIAGISNGVIVGVEKTISASTIPQAGNIIGLPSSFILGDFLTSPFVLINIIMLALASTVMANISGVTVRWSNLLLVVAVSLLAITLLNPFFRLDDLLASHMHIIATVAALGAIFPLLMSQKLPQGGEILPAAICLTLLVNISLFGGYVLLFVVTLWLIRSFIERSPLSIELLFSLTLLITLPIISWQLWANHVGVGGVGFLFNQLSDLNPSKEIFATTNSLYIPAIVAILIVIVWAALHFINNFRRQAMSDFFTKDAWLIIPALLGIYYFLIVLLTPVMASASLLQFVILVPFWRLGMTYYIGSRLQKQAYKSPWLIGLVIATLLMLLQIINADTIKQKASSALNHVWQVSHDIGINANMPQNSKIAVLGGGNNPTYWAAAMQYGLANKAIINSVDRPYNQLKVGQNALSWGLFHRYLAQNKFNYIWIHSPSENERKALGKNLRSDYSYLYKIEAKGVTLQDKYPHLTYSQPRK